MKTLPRYFFDLCFFMIGTYSLLHCLASQIQASVWLSKCSILTVMGRHSYIQTLKLMVNVHFFSWLRHLIRNFLKFKLLVCENLHNYMLFTSLLGFYKVGLE